LCLTLAEALEQRPQLCDIETRGTAKWCNRFSPAMRSARAGHLKPRTRALSRMAASAGMQ
jgi:hypothetical protein